jgi:ribonuclease HII
VAGAVILPEGLEIEGLNDSKKLSEKKREQVYEEIVASALSWAVGFADEREIDEKNILQATFCAMRRAVASLSVVPDIVLVDGNQDPRCGLVTRTIVRGDGICASIAAASVIAKVTRDRMLVLLDEQYPQFGFARHKGYATAEHVAALHENGPCAVHRRSFLKNFLG